MVFCKILQNMNVLYSPPQKKNPENKSYTPIFWVEPPKPIN